MNAEQPTLVESIINEMRQTNDPSVFNIDNDGNQVGTSQGQMQPPTYQQIPVSQDTGRIQQMPMNTQSGASPQTVSPDLIRKFTEVLKYSPQIAEQFANPTVLTQAMNNSQLMMETIAQFEQLQAQQ